MAVERLGGASANADGLITWAAFRIDPGGLLPIPAWQRPRPRRHNTKDHRVQVRNVEAMTIQPVQHHGNGRGRGSKGLEPQRTLSIPAFHVIDRSI